MSAFETEKLMCPHANNYNYFPLTDNAATLNSSHNGELGGLDPHVEF